MFFSAVRIGTRKFGGEILVIQIMDRVAVYATRNYTVTHDA